MVKALRYFAWNGVTMCTLILSSVFSWHTGIVLCGVWFGIEAVTYFLVNTLNDKTLEDLWPKLEGIGAWVGIWYKIPCEVFWIAVAFYFGHNYIGIAMVITFFSWLYLWARKIEHDKKAFVDRRASIS